MIEMIEHTELEKNPTDLKDVLDKLIEECAEVIQAAAKINAFGLDDTYNSVTNRSRLVTELGDVLCLISILVDNGVVDESGVMIAIKTKELKLKRWAPTVAKYLKG